MTENIDGAARSSIILSLVMIIQRALPFKVATLLMALQQHSMSEGAMSNLSTAKSMNFRKRLKTNKSDLRESIAFFLYFPLKIFVESEFLILPFFLIDRE